jgi:pyrimidine-nucleoside phosphorylase
MRIYDIIKNKRDGLELSIEEIDYFITEYTAGNIPDYQAAALIMAIFINKMNTAETVALTQAMMHSGHVMNLDSISGIKVDKHSTGGVGDTTTLLLGPMVAACGVPVAKMSGRGLGHTGGTIDKLEAIKGFHVELSTADFIEQVKTHGIAVIGQSKGIAPADKKLYALRDVTATVDNVSLIAGSIMSKKLAAGSNAIVLDVKMGSGAFMKTLEDAKALSKAMVDIGNGMGRKTIAVITNMDQPLGFAVGNALEVQEAMDTLNGKGPKDLEDLCITLGGLMVYLGKMADSPKAGEALVIENLKNGKAYAKFIEFVKAQGGSEEALMQLPKASIVQPVLATVSGFVAHIASEDIGLAAMGLGAGRQTIDSVIDMASGIMLNKKVGDSVSIGECIAYLHTNDLAALEEAQTTVLKAFQLTEQQITVDPLIQAIIE